MNFTIPEGGFWHCQISHKKSAWPIYIFDRNYEQIDFEIVQPFKKGNPFIVNGTVFNDRSEVVNIKIVYSSQKHDYYGKKSLSGYGVLVLAPDVPLVFEKGEDWTARLLYTDEPILNNQATEKGKLQALTIVNNVNQTQSQTQHQEQNLTLSNIQQLQDAFADFRQEYKKLHGVDDSILKETQDVLDELSTTSSASEKNKAFSKLRCVLKGAEKVFDRVGEKATKALLFYETLKKIYNTIMGFFSN